jgi:hypothetical protein
MLANGLHVTRAAEMTKMFVGAPEIRMNGFFADGSQHVPFDA